MGEPLCTLPQDRDSAGSGEKSIISFLYFFYDTVPLVLVRQFVTFKLMIS